MLKTQGQSSDLLSERLANRKKSAPSEAVDVKSLRHKEEAGTGSVPTYGPGQCETIENETTTNRRQLTKRPKREKPPKREKKPRRRDMAYAAPDDDVMHDDAESFDELITEQEYKRIKRQQKFQNTKIRISKIAVAIIVLLCLYCSFLIYGLVQTNYIYNNNGEVVPEVLSVEDLQTLKQYNTLSNYYLRTRILYEDVLKVDYDLTQNPDNGALLAMEYTELLDKVSKLSTDLEASKLDTGYQTILKQMYDLVHTHIAVYLQNISNALTSNDQKAATEAVAGREVVKSQFRNLTSNMAMLCNATNGAKNGDIYAWSPDAYIQSMAEQEVATP